MKIICPVNNKGGVGKTTVTKTLCEYFSIVQKKRVLAIDLDQQCNLSMRYITMETYLEDGQQEKMPPVVSDFNEMKEEPIYQGWNGRCSTADIYLGLPVLPYSTPIKNLEIIPGNSKQLSTIEHVRKDEVATKVHNQLEKFLNCEEVKESYDIVVIDTPPSKGPLTTSAIRAGTHVVIPSIMEPQPIEGIFGMLQLWKQEQTLRVSHNPIHLLGILPNMFATNLKLHNGILDDLKGNPLIKDYIIPHKLVRRVAYAELDSEGMKPLSVFELSNNDPAKIEALNFCDYINQRIN